MELWYGEIKTKSVASFNQSESALFEAIKKFVFDIWSLSDREEQSIQSQVSIV